jgi:hypothetical protein
MRAVSKIVVMVAAGALAMLAMMAPASAGRSTTAVVTASDTDGYEYVKSCDNTAPYSCHTDSGKLVFLINASNTPNNSAISVSYQIVAGTATAGVDYLGPYTGTVTVTPGFPTNVIVPLVNDGSAELAETVSLHLTGASVSANLTSVGHGTVKDGGSVPVDCNFTRDASSASVTCTARPATQQWQATVQCQNPDLDWPTNMNNRVGNIVTGNGTSVANCDPGFGVTYQDWHIVG